VALPEGGKLIAKRTDQDYFSANIDTEMYRYLEYSRFALVDITGLNANVFYELGIRHHAYQSGTAIFRQGDKVIPFDISHIKAFPYEYQPMEEIKKSVDLVTKVLTESLIYNRIDSPVQIALASQQKQEVNIDGILTEAKNAIRNGDFTTAVNKYKQAIEQNKSNPVLYLEMGLLFKNLENWKESVSAFSAASELSPEYSEAWRELGIARNKIFNKEKTPDLPTGENDLLKAIELNPNDFDAYASLGGIYKRLDLISKSAEMYNRAVDVSNGHPYPLLNAVILQVREKGIDSITAKQKIFMKRAEIPLRKQVSDVPPYNSPWCFFDLSTICLFLGKPDEAQQILESGAVMAKDWETKTHLNTLLLIENCKNDLPGLENLIIFLKSISE
ncbi:MAG: tetratricopeptide repeat protein, partial [Bacteroidota bacterium]